MEALREIIVNSFAHADYRGLSENEIDITPTQVEIYNPGEFPQDLTPVMFAEDRIKSMPRNKVILNALYKSKDVEMFGSGFKKVYAVCRQSGIRTDFHMGYGGFSFIFFRIQMRSREEMAGIMGKTVRTVQRALDKLSGEGRIRRIGTARAGYWEVVQDRREAAGGRHAGMEDE